MKNTINTVQGYMKSNLSYLSAMKKLSLLSLAFVTTISIAQHYQPNWQSFNTREVPAWPKRHDTCYYLM
ncbi:MAG TPA: hypothetical protein VFW07_28795 [Parafilimonas sp.]|nr:hypothetical protein [Parafilimonas sp.]